MQNQSDNSSDSSNKFLLIWLHTGFILIGIITVLIGQILPILSNRLSLTDSDSGYFFIAQFSGSLIGVFLYNQGIKKLGYVKTLLIGFILMACGSAGLNFGQFGFCLLMVLTFGVGIGLTIPLTNMLIVELNHAKAASRLNFINFFWGIGAIFCKPFIDFVGTSESFLVPTFVLSVVLLINGLLIGFSRINEQISLEKPLETTIYKPIWKTPTAWLIAVFNFIHIGIESSVGGWITTFEERLPDNSPYKWFSAAFVFFLFLVIGRGIAPLFVKFLKENTLLFINILIMSAGAFLVLQAETFQSTIVGAGILGFGSSSVFPTNMARFTNIFGQESSRQATPIFVMGSLGGAFMTWAVGFVSTTFNSLRTGFLIVVAGCLTLLILQIIISISRNNAIEKT